jgi:hypothetical protein
VFVVAIQSARERRQVFRNQGASGVGEFGPQSARKHLRELHRIEQDEGRTGIPAPTLCIFEDAHWLDPSTLELLDLIISRIGHARVLLIVSCRPEFRPPWIGRVWQS